MSVPVLLSSLCDAAEGTSTLDSADSSPDRISSFFRFLEVSFDVCDYGLIFREIYSNLGICAVAIILWRGRNVDVGFGQLLVRQIDCLSSFFRFLKASFDVCDYGLIFRGIYNNVSICAVAVIA